MNTSSDKFAPPDPAEVPRLIESFPLAWLVSAEPEFLATPLPLRPHYGDTGNLVELHGHMSRGNPQVAALQAQPRALALFIGPHGYVSPSWMNDRTQAPTWNYASAQFVVEAQFVGSDAELDPMLDDLVETMEEGRERCWHAAEMGERYRKLTRRIIGFRLLVRGGRVKFKLGQDERDDIYGDIVRGLADEGSTELLGWMHRCNPGRAPE